MKQVTPKRLLDALLWIHTNRHHSSGLEYSKDGSHVTHHWFENYHDKLRVSAKAPWNDRFHQLVRGNPRPHDDRMFALTRNGRHLLRVMAHEARIEINWKEHP